MAGDVDTSDYLASARDKGGELMRTVHEGDQMLIADAPLIVSNVLNPKWYSQQDTQQSNKKDLPTTLFGQSSRFPFTIEVLRYLDASQTL